MSAVVILGAGELGGALARQLAAADLVSSIALVDDAGTVAEGKALDILQASPVDGYSTAVVGTRDLSAVIGAGVIVLADRASISGTTAETSDAGEWQDDAGIRLVGRAARLNSTAPIVCAGVRQMAMIERGIRELGLARARVLGSAPEALRAAVVSMTALEAGCVPADICLTVLGRPPKHIIVPWEDASIGGRRASSVLSPPAISRLDARLPKLWPPGPLALASAATRLIQALLSRPSALLTAFVAVTREEGELGRVAMLPVSVTPKGLGSVMAPLLSTRDQVRLDTALFS